RSKRTTPPLPRHSSTFPPFPSLPAGLTPAPPAPPSGADPPPRPAAPAIIRLIKTVLSIAPPKTADPTKKIFQTRAPQSPLNRCVAVLERPNSSRSDVDPRIAMVCLLHSQGCSEGGR